MFHTVSVSSRTFPMDMACFAVNIGFWRSRGAPYQIDLGGYVEDCFLKDMNVTFDDMEPKADNCTQVT